MAAEVFVNKHENVNYFPSFEMATLGPQDVIWGGRDDFRHVNRHFVEIIMYHALEAFMERPPENLSISKVTAMVHALLDAGMPDDALTVLERYKMLHKPELEKLQRSVEKALSGRFSSNAPKLSALLSLEKWIFSRILTKRHLRKYLNARHSFFSDSRSPLLRLWGRIGA